MTARASAPERLPVWRRTDVWVPAVLAAVLLPLGLFFGLRPTRGPSAAERAVLRSLQEYGVRYELDENGRLARLILEGKHVTDDALDQVCLVPRLRRLSLHNSSVTDAGLAKLMGLKRLQNLGITNTNVTDRGLKTLEQMSSLQNIWLCESDKLTPKGIASLRRALPAANVHVMNRPAPKAAGQAEPSSGPSPSP